MLRRLFPDRGRLACQVDCKGCRSCKVKQAEYGQVTGLLETTAVELFQLSESLRLANAIGLVK